MKKLIEKIKSVGWDKWSKILIGFLVLAILWTMFFALRASAVDFTDSYFVDSFTKYSDYYYKPVEITFVSGSGSAYEYVDAYLICNGAYGQVSKQPGTVVLWNLNLTSSTTYDYLELLTDYVPEKYNIYKISSVIQQIGQIEFKPDYNNEIYGIYFVNRNATYVDNIVNSIFTTVSDLNSDDYVVQLQTIYSNGEQINVLQTNTNSGVIYDTQIYTGASGQIRVVGQVATTEGVEYYTASAGSDSIGILSNSSSDQSVTTDIVNYINSSDLKIYDYDHNGVFDFTIDLTDYYFETIPLTINAHSNEGRTRFLVGIIQVSVFSPNETPPEESDSESESESESESVPGSDSGTDSPGEIETDDGSFDEGYLAGYEQALRDQQIGVFGQATLDAYFHFTHSEGIDIPILVKFSVDPSSGSIDFLQVWNWYSSSMYNTSDYTLVDIELDILFPSGFKWEEGIMFVSFSPEYSASASWLPYNTEAFSVEHEDGAMLNINYGVMTGKNRWYLTQPSSYTSDLSIDMIRFDINDKNISYEDFFATYRFTLHTNISTYTVQTYSYNQGYNDGWNRGSDSGYKEGFDRAYDLGYEEGHEFAFSQGYNEAKDVYYEEGKKAGIFIGKQEAPDDFQFYDLFYSVFDAPLAVLRTTFNFEIFGVNIAGFLLGLFTLLLAHKAIKLVI